MKTAGDEEGRQNQTTHAFIGALHTLDYLTGGVVELNC